MLTQESTTAQPKTATIYVSPTARESMAWHDRGLCFHCGSEPLKSACFCRRCDSCTETWKSTTRAAYEEGPNCSDVPAKEYCPFCKQCVADLLICVTRESDTDPDAVLWRDIFCENCGVNECLEGTAQQLVDKVFELGWITENGDASCPKCQSPQPVSEQDAEAEEAYSRWKDSRFEN